MKQCEKAPDNRAIRRLQNYCQVLSADFIRSGFPLEKSLRFGYETELL